MRRNRWRTVAIVSGSLVVGVLLPAGGAEADTSTSWSIVQSANPSDYNVLNGVSALSASNAWAVGYRHDNSNPGFVETLTEHWNGTKWKAISAPNPGTQDNAFAGVAMLSARDVWAVGYYVNVGDDHTETLVEHWDGKSWTVVPSPNPSTGNQLEAVTATGDGELIAVGEDGPSATGGSQALIERWDGSQWNVDDSPGTPDGGELTAVSARSSDDIWAAGNCCNNTQPNYGTLFEHWDGASWQIVPSPNAPGDNFLRGISIVPGTADVLAVGFSREGPEQPLAERWNGSTWSIASPPALPYGVLNGVTAISSTDAWAVGYYFKRRNGRTLVEHWDGQTWKVVASPNPTKESRLSGVASVEGSSVTWAVGSCDPRRRRNTKEKTVIERST
jgi:hypothetical protein